MAFKINAAKRLAATSTGGWSAMSVADTTHAGNEDGDWQENVNALGQGELVNAALHKVVAERLQDYVKRLKKLGIKQLGSGSFADVFQHPTMPNVVVKLLTEKDKAYEAYVKFSQAHKGNKYVPKILQVVEADEAFDKAGEYDMGDLRLIFMEKLTPMEDSDYLKFGRYVVGLVRSDAETLSKAYVKLALNSRQTWVYLAKQKKDKDIAQIADFVIKTLTSVKGADLDMHEGNFMLRGTKPIVTDPFSTYD